MRSVTSCVTAALALGVAVYLFDRNPRHVYLLPAWLSASAAHSATFGAFGAWLPSFLHTYAFAILTALALGATPRAVLAGSLIWWGIGSLIELGQLPAVSQHIAALAPAWFDGRPVLENIVPYFTHGTFDPRDMAASAAGAALAGFTLMRFTIIRFTTEGRCHEQYQKQ